jgi:hypothetical protein
MKEDKDLGQGKTERQMESSYKIVAIAMLGMILIVGGLMVAALFS